MLFRSRNASGQASGSHSSRSGSGTFSSTAQALAAATSSGEEPTGSRRLLIVAPDGQRVSGAVRRLCFVQFQIGDRLRQLHALNALNVQGGVDGRQTNVAAPPVLRADVFFQLRFRCLLDDRKSTLNSSHLGISY